MAVIPKILPIEAPTINGVLSAVSFMALVAEPFGTDDESLKKELCDGIKMIFESWRLYKIKKGEHQYNYHSSILSIFISAFHIHQCKLHSSILSTFISVIHIHQ